MSVSRRRRPVVTLLLSIAFSVAAGAVGLFLLSLTAERPRNLGVQDGRLASCPGSPNCVSTQAADREHWIAPISVGSSAISPIETLADIVRSMPRTTIVEQSNNYLRVEFRSLIFRFPDDVEFYFEPESARIHFRSASRVGHSDLGANRDRMETIRQRWMDLAVPSETDAPSNALNVRRKEQMLV